MALAAGIAPALLKALQSLLRRQKSDCKDCKLNNSLQLSLRDNRDVS